LANFWNGRTKRRERRERERGERGERVEGTKERTSPKGRCDRRYHKVQLNPFLIVFLKLNISNKIKKFIYLKCQFN